MSTPLSEIVQGYATLGSELLARWSDRAAAAAAKLDAGTYDADSAAADLAATASLATETGVRLAAQALVAAGALCGCAGEPYAVESGAFRTNVKDATLTVPGPLRNGFGSDTLPAVLVRPVVLQADDAGTTFRLHADATGRRSGFYSGVVEASNPAGHESVTVWIIVA